MKSDAHLRPKLKLVSVPASLLTHLLCACEKKLCFRMTRFTPLLVKFNSTKVSHPSSHYICVKLDYHWCGHDYKLTLFTNYHKLIILKHCTPEFYPSDRYFGKTFLNLSPQRIPTSYFIFGRLDCFASGVQKLKPAMYDDFFFVSCIQWKSSRRIKIWFWLDSCTLKKLKKNNNIWICMLYHFLLAININICYCI